MAKPLYKKTRAHYHIASALNAYYSCSSNCCTRSVTEKQRAPRVILTHQQISAGCQMRSRSAYRYQGVPAGNSTWMQRSIAPQERAVHRNLPRTCAT
eukprot:6196025-Pleurochrysis_carterae.AAC.4